MQITKYFNNPQKFSFHDDDENIVVSQDSKQLASGGDDESVCLLEINSGSLVVRIFSNERKMFSLVFLNEREAFIQKIIWKLQYYSLDKKNIILINIFGKGAQSLNEMQSTFSDAKITSKGIQDDL